MKAKQIKIPRHEVTFYLECLPEDLPIEGNCMASGDDTADREQEQWVYAQLRSGNEWAWCCARVRAVWKDFEGNDYLGACSYLSEEDFMRGGYFADMKNEAYRDLTERVRQSLEKAKRTAKALGIECAS